MRLTRTQAEVYRIFATCRGKWITLADICHIAQRTIRWATVNALVKHGLVEKEVCAGLAEYRLLRWIYEDDSQE